MDLNDKDLVRREKEARAFLKELDKIKKKQKFTPSVRLCIAFGMAVAMACFFYGFI